MSIRLNKALRNLNISLKTATDFLLRHKELGEIREEPSFKLNENQYEALCLEFNNTNETKNHIAYLHFIKKSFLLAFPTENLSKRLRVYTIVDFSFIRTFAPSF